MCDTIGKIMKDGRAIFAKNSGRSPNEPQVVEFIEHKIHEEEELKCSYITIPQVKETYALVLSRPVWLWGGEMGVNEYGVCIGNEAVFSKGKYGEESLIGMDYLRLALERGKTAGEAMKVITDLLAIYDQGGNCGYDKDFHYDNSYLIMDRNELFVLETSGKHWVYKQYDHASISNRLRLRDEGDAYSEEVLDFTDTYSDTLFSTFSRAKERQSLTCSARLEDIYDAFAILRTHSVEDPMSRGSVSSVCMHAGDMFADQTTASMVVELDDDIHIYLTGSSRPCLSLFKAHDFSVNGIVYPEGQKGNDAYWRKQEARQRKLLGRKIPQDLYEKRNAYEKQLIEEKDKDFLKKEEDFYSYYENNYVFKEIRCAPGFKSYWKKKNEVFERETEQEKRS